MLSEIMLLLDTFPWMAPVIAFVFGASVGSFLNVVVYRLPVMLNREWQQQALDVLDETTQESELIRQLRERLPPPTEKFNLVVPNSRCPHCDTAIRPWHNIPIFGYFLIGGRCASCRAPVSARYPLVETGTALLSMATIFAFGPTLAGVAACVLTWALVALALIDFDTQLLPDDITLPFLWIGLTINFFGLFSSFTDAFIGACLGYLALWFVFQAFRLITGKEGMGYGDFKMLAMLGAWLGYQMVPLIIVLSSFAGAVIGGVMILFGRDRTRPIKFGPFLAIAGWIALLWGHAIVDTYLSLTIQ